MFGGTFVANFVGVAEAVCRRCRCRRTRPKVDGAIFTWGSCGSHGRFVITARNAEEGFGSAVFASGETSLKLQRYGIKSHDGNHILKLGDYK